MEHTHCRPMITRADVLLRARSNRLRRADASTDARKQTKLSTLRGCAYGHLRLLPTLRLDLPT
eukprot:11162464-Lingulodinium_polyedra.AAC.1